MKRKEKKEKIKQLKKTNSAFSKGCTLTKLTVVLCLLLLLLMQGYIVWFTGGIYENALIHLGLQAAAVLLILSGKAFFVLVYGAAMLGSLVMACVWNLEAFSEFYVVQMAYFFVSFILMMFLYLLPSTRTYRKELKNVRTGKVEEAPVLMQEEAESEPEIVIEPEVSETKEVSGSKEYLTLVCEEKTDFSYGSFSRFLVQHYPFVYLHPKFDVEAAPFVQLCISADGFDQDNEELYSGTFLFHYELVENEKKVQLEYTDEMSRLCALICADWLVMSKAKLIKDEQDISADLMKLLTESFVLARDAEKVPFEGFKRPEL